MSEETAEPQTQTLPKLDPESLAIRAQPLRAIRFRRGVIIGIAAVGSVSLMAIAFVELKPASLHFSSEPQQDMAQPANAGANDAVNALPANYGTVPQLGSPLPGDLGRPILEHQRSMASEGYGSANGTEDQARQAALAEQDRLLAQRKAARESGLLVQGAGTQAGVRADQFGSAPSSPSDATVPDMSRLALDPERDPNAQQRKVDFVKGQDVTGDINPHRIAAAPSPYLLSAGSIISASLITGLRSDLPGLVTAQVSERVYDSPTGRILLIPQGARLIGSYDSVVAFGQSRALVVWKRIILPDGSSLRIDNVPATDPSGYAGLADRIDFHTWALLKGIALSTLLGVGSELTFSGDSDLVQAIRQSTQQNVSRAGDQITSRNLNIQPTITIRPGAPVRLVVHKDLILAPWKG